MFSQRSRYALRASAVKSLRIVLGVLAVKCIGIRFCIFGGSLPPIRRTDIGGGITRAIRCTSVRHFSGIEPNLPCRKNVNSADTARAPACHFSGKIAHFAVCANQKESIAALFP